MTRTIFSFRRYSPFLLSTGLLLAASAGQSALARELWVDHDSKGGSCSDSRAATAVTQTTPLCTLGAGANLVAPGDTVHVRGGTYSEPHNCSKCDGTAVLQPVVAGTSSQWIRFVAEPGETVIVQPKSGPVNGVRVVVAGSVTPSFNEFSGFNVRNASKTCIFVNAVPDIRLIDMEATGCGVGAVELHNTQRVTFEGGRVHDNNTTGWTSAIDLFQCKDGNVVRGNLVWGNSDSPVGNPDSEGHGIIMDYCQTAGGALIENNVIWNNEGWCMTVYHSDGATIRNNTCYNNGIRPDGSGEMTILGNRVSIYNNVLTPRSGHFALSMRYNTGAYSVDTATLQENFNLIGAPASAQSLAYGGNVGTLAQYQSNNPRGWGGSSRAADALFANAAGSDFHLTSGSPARDTGDNLHAASIDADGRARPFNTTVDRGAYEFGASGTALNPPTNLRVTSP